MSLDKHIFEVMQLIFYHMDSTESKQNKEYARNLACLIYDMSDESSNQKTLSEQGVETFMTKLRAFLDKEFPIAQKMKADKNKEKQV